MRLLHYSLHATTGKASQPASVCRFSTQKRKRAWTISATAAFALLLAARLLSAWLNIIHDCDEVFNYWEPLHYLLYGYGLQTWEYRQDSLTKTTRATSLQPATCSSVSSCRQAHAPELYVAKVAFCCSAQFALRPYLYLLLHTSVAGPAALWFGSGAGQWRFLLLCCHAALTHMHVCGPVEFLDCFRD